MKRVKSQIKKKGFFVHVCMHMCVGMCAYSCVWRFTRMHMYVETRRQLPVSFLRCHLPFDLRHMWLTWRSPNRLDWLARKLQGSTDLCLLSDGTISTTMTSFLFVCLLWCELQGSNSGPCACKLNTLLTDPSPKSQKGVFIAFFHLINISLYIWPLKREWIGRKGKKSGTSQIEEMSYL